MNIIIACEESGALRTRFREQGHNCWSSDLKPSRDASPYHYKGNCFDIIENPGIVDVDTWDMMIAHPPCTHLANSGNAHRATKRADGRESEAIAFFLRFTTTGIKRWAIENPTGIMSSLYRPPDQIIQPHYFGDNQRKTTCLWFNNLPPLFWSKEDDLFSQKTYVEPKLVTKVSLKTGRKHTYSAHEFHASKHRDRTQRSEIRSKTFDGIADAMVEQWGNLKVI